VKAPAGNAQIERESATASTQATLDDEEKADGTAATVFLSRRHVFCGESFLRKLLCEFF
jgi:hypothetical protein